MSVLFDARYSDMGSFATQIKPFFQGALTHNHQTTLSFLFSKQNQTKEVEKELQEKGYTLHYIHSRPFQPFEHIELFKTLKKIRPTFFHSPHFNLPFFHPKTVKLACTIHDLALDIFPDEVNSLFHQWYYKTMMKKAMKSHRIIAISDFTKSSIVSHYHPKNIEVILNGFVPPSRIETQPRKSKTLLYVGMNKPRKNLAFLIRVIEALPEEYSLIIAGNMKSKTYNLTQDVISKNLEDRVHILGHINADHLTLLYETATCLIFPSLLEGFGYPILEAAHYKLPVLCAQSSSLPEVGNKACLYFDPKDIQDCQEKCITLCNSPDLQKQLTLANQENLERFNVTAYYNKVMKPYLK